ncbi:MAG: N-acetylmuramoyl-L-alanine amidase [Burkholderiales bacterium]|nr:N-acetylmuramoyl-L-alanine amidase [Anaerolineae bacterium]
MPDNLFYPPPENPDADPPHRESDEPLEAPASVAFMEMMRQAAQKKAAPPPPTPESPPGGGLLFPGYVEVAPEEDEDADADDAYDETDELDSDEDPALDEQDEPERPVKIKPNDPAYAKKMEQQRVQRVKRRRARARRRTVGVIGSIIRSFLVVGVAAMLVATIFTWWTPTQFLSSGVRDELSMAQATTQATSEPTALATPNWLRRIGIVAGHRGPENDPGAVCPDGLTEKSITENVAQLVVRNLRGRGYSVDLLDEFDPRLQNYHAAALVSIHANTCQDFGNLTTGFLIASALARATAIGPDEILVDCVRQHYGQSTGLPLSTSDATVDMTDYHSFREIHPLTPAAIIELGFMLADRDVLTERPDALARGITDGILCFLEPGSNPGAVPTLPPNAAEPEVLPPNVAATENIVPDSNV